MSHIHQIRGGWEALKGNLPDILAGYEEDLTLAESRLAMKGKTLEACLKDQAAWPIVYSTMKAELDTISKYINVRVEYQRGMLYRQLTENHSRELSDRAKDKYIDNEDDYVKYQELYLEVKEMADKASAVVDAFTTRGFALRDITQLRINQLHSTEL